MSDEQRDDAGVERPKVKVVDKRRVRADGAAPAPDAGAAQPSPERHAELPPETRRDLEDELEQAQRKAAEYLDHLQRLQAEFDNYRKRVLKEQTRAVEMAAQPFVMRLLEVLDDFELAVASAGQQPDLERFRKGVELVYAKLFDALKAEGLERIETEGRPFDPTEHEALMQTGEGTGEPHVAEVFRQGYRLKGSVIRPAGVRVERS
jgi:molecular chaperone GrpE